MRGEIFEGERNERVRRAFAVRLGVRPDGILEVVIKVAGSIRADNLVVVALLVVEVFVPAPKLVVGGCDEPANAASLGVLPGEVAQGGKRCRGWRGTPPTRRPTRTRRSGGRRRSRGGASRRGAGTESPRATAAFSRVQRSTMARSFATRGPSRSAAPETSRKSAPRARGTRVRARGGASRRAPRATSRRGRVAPARALSSPPRPRRHPPRASPEQSVALASGSSSRSDRNTRIGWRRTRSGPSPARSNARARDGRDASARGVTPSAGTNAIVIRSAVGSSKRSMFSCRCAIDVTTMRRFSDTPAPSLTLARDSNSVHLRWERGERGRGEMKRRKKGPGGRRRRRHRDPQNRRMYCWLRSQKFIADLDVFSSSGTGAGLGGESDGSGSCQMSHSIMDVVAMPPESMQRHMEDGARFWRV